jgi:hypothetical protein
MGWISYQAQYYKNGTVDRKKECDEYWEGGLNRGHFKILKSTMVGSTYYAAVQVLKEYVGKDKDNNDIYKDVEDGQVFGIIFLTSINMKDYHNFSYKPMDETMGPHRYDCPISILRLLSETDNEYALKWRQKCWDNHNQKKNPNGIHKLPEDSVIKVIMPFDTTYCKEGQEVMLFKKKWGKRSKWFMKNTNVYFTQGLMKCVTENGFEIIQRGELI